MTPIEEQIMKIWVEIPQQGDPTGKKFAVAFALAILEELQVYILSYSDGMYPEDNEIIGIYTDLKTAESIRDERIKDYSHTEMNKGKAWNYSITQQNLTTITEKE